MKTNEKGIELIKQFEGFIPNIYFCPAGYPTIGYGHLCREGDLYLKGKTLNLPKKELKKINITNFEAEELLKKDLKTSEIAVRRLIKVPLNENQFSALVSFTFNLGSGALQRSTLRRKLNRGEYFKASLEFRRWVYAGGRKLKGLVKRRYSETYLFCLPHYLNV